LFGKRGGVDGCILLICSFGVGRVDALARRLAGRYTKIVFNRQNTLLESE
jgi:hypothetical protein